MANTLSNKCSKNYCKRTILVQVIIKDVVTCFFRIQYIWSDLPQLKTDTNPFLTTTDPRCGVLTLTLTDPRGGELSENLP